MHMRLNMLFCRSPLEKLKAMAQNSKSQQMRSRYFAQYDMLLTVWTPMQCSANIDANTEFSALTIEQVNASENDLETCREELFKLVNSETILIGHSLESDFKALCLVHHNVVDTSLLFKSGPHKPALRNLTKQHLGRNIQSDNVNTFGHSSAEDAKACIDLVKEYITCHH
ncbi:unnamed protein product [Caenorhabditis angaria]|uniref:Exonuclease domain-containing protein n=1 Tax=Caenorhabditis angaria TaxID=860376 RepID=A0A9P1NCC3_9PELO|nr:unnamed protein product [Caenorhabditis angaria]